MKLSILVPAYNEIATIVAVLERIHAHPIEDVDFQVIVIDDGSKDGTREALRERPDLYDQLIERERNGGKGAAVRDGLAAADGDFILFQDADLEYDPAEYSRLLKPVTEHEADVVIGSRFLGPDYVRVHYFWHMVGNKMLTLFFNVLFNQTFTDIYSCYLLFRRGFVDGAALKSDGWEQHAEILCTATRRARRVYEVPINYAGRTYDEGKKIRGWHAIQVLAMIARKRLFG